MAIEEELSTGYSLDTCNSKQRLSNRLLFRHKIIPSALGPDHPIRQVPNNCQISGISLVLQNVLGRLRSAENSFSTLKKYNKIQFFATDLFFPLPLERVSLTNTAWKYVSKYPLSIRWTKHFLFQPFFVFTHKN